MHPNIPSINFNSFLGDSASDRRRIALAIDQALSSVGFIHLHNHGIEQRKIDTCFQWVSFISPSCNSSLAIANIIATGQSKRLFALSESQKAAIHPLSPPHDRGYSGIGNEKVRNRTCMKESFDCGNPEDDERRNSWPREELLPGFRQFTEDFFQVQSFLIVRLKDLEI